MLSVVLVPVTVGDEAAAALAMIGAASAVPVMLTLSKTAVVAVPLLCEQTARPTRTVEFMVIVRVAPVCVQVEPSDDRHAEKLLPLRTTRTQYGAATPVILVSLELPLR